MKRKRSSKQSTSGIHILVNVGPVEKRIAVLDNGKLIDYFMEREGLENYAGSVYKGKVTSIVPGIEAAFVDIGLEKNGFLHVDDVINKSSVLKEMLPDGEEPPVKNNKRKGKSDKINNILKVNQDMLVQVVKEELGTKGARLTTYLSLPGRYVVLTPFDNHIGISRRIKNKDERKRIRDIIGSFNFSKGMGCIVRTMAENITEKELREELKYLLNLWTRIKSRGESNPAPVVVYEEYGAVLRTVRDKFTDNVNQLIVDSKDEYLRIIKFLKSFRPGLRKKVKLYKGKESLFRQYDIEKQVNEIFERKVYLKSGGYIVIEQTEGLVAIDVNTGKFVGKNNLEETAFKTNIEAAQEIPRQLLLRDIGGIVIIDFIDMEEKKHREKVYNMLQQHLSVDKARISLRSISQFGVVEMTRQRMRKSLESASHSECPYCSGRGVIKSADTIAIETVRKIDRVLSSSKKNRKHISVTTHPDVNDVLIYDQARMLSDIQRKYRCNIDLKHDPTLHREETIVNEH